MKAWENNNIFRSYVADDVFRYDVLEKIADDYKAHMKDKNKKVTRENMEEAISEMIDNITSTIDWFLDEEFEEDEEDE